MLWFVFFISCREPEHNAFSFDTLKVLLFFQMSLQDAMQRHCQEAIQGIFTTGPFTIVFFDVGPTRKLSPIKTKVLSDAGEIRTGWATTKDTCDPAEKDGLTWTITLVVGLAVRSGCVNST